MQNRTGAITLILLLAAWWLHGQSCPVVTGPTEVKLPNGVTKACSGIDLQIKTTVTNISPTSHLVVYAGSLSGYDPTKGEGTLLKTFTFDQVSCQNPTCPTLIGAMINACVGESNEYMTFNSGSGFAVNDLLVDLDENNNNLPGICPSGCEDPGSGACPFKKPAIASLGGCSVIPAGPGDVIPPNAVVILFMSADASPNVYNWSALCSEATKSSVPIYVLQSSCTRAVGAFTDNPNGIRRYTVNFCSTCSSTISYAQNMPEGTFFIWPDRPQAAPCLGWPDLGLQALTFNLTLSESLCDKNQAFIKLVWKQGNTVCSTVTPSIGNPVQVDCPVISITGDTTYCSGSSLQLTGNALNGQITQWNWKNGSFKPTGRIINVTSQTGLFTLTGSNPLTKCTATTSIDISQIPLPDAGLLYLPNDTICVNEPVTIQAPTADAYAWSTGNTTQAINLIVTDDQDFTVTLTNGGKCHTEAGGQIIADRNASCLSPSFTCPELELLPGIDTFCLAQTLRDTLIRDVPAVVDPGARIRWYGPGIVDSTNRFVPYLSGPGTIVDTVEITINDTCHYTLLDTVVLLDATVEFLSPDTICLDDF
ncbi:MAG: hypothetical protein R2806_02365 [Saprospiraceae bacterium]